MIEYSSSDDGIHASKKRELNLKNQKIVKSTPYQIWLAEGNTGTEQDFLDSLQGDSAYQVWLAEGNTGTVQDYLDSLVGADGADGADGASAYQIWLNNGNTGTETDFINSLEGADGADGADGDSAYQIWLNNGNTGTETDFINSLEGADGADGADGASAYQIWLNNGNTGTETDFINSLEGADGADGDSAYQIWLNNGNTGTEQDFLNKYLDTNLTEAEITDFGFTKDGSKWTQRVDGTIFRDGNVGIGNIIPQHLLDVNGDIRSKIFRIENNAPQFRWTQTTGDTDNKSMQLIMSLGDLIIQALNDSGGGGGDFLKITRSDNNITGFEWYDNANLKNKIANVGSSFITAGNFGIGTDDPIEIVHIIVPANGKVLIEDGSSVSNAPVLEVIGKRSDGNTSQSFGGGVALSNLKTTDFISTNKSLGSIYFGGNHTDGSIENIAYAASIVGMADGNFNSVNDMPIRLSFRTGSIGKGLHTVNSAYGTERMRIDSLGNVTIHNDLFVEDVVADNLDLTNKLTADSAEIKSTDFKIEDTNATYWRIVGGVLSYGHAGLNRNYLNITNNAANDAVIEADRRFLMLRSKNSTVRIQSNFLGGGIGDNNSIQFLNGNIEVARFQADKLAIGRTIPTEKLDVDGNIRTREALLVDGIATLSGTLFALASAIFNGAITCIADVNFTGLAQDTAPTKVLTINASGGVKETPIANLSTVDSSVCFVKNANQLLNNTTWTNITFDSEVGGVASISGGVIKTDTAGLYTVSYVARLLCTGTTANASIEFQLYTGSAYRNSPIVVTTIPNVDGIDKGSVSLQFTFDIPANTEVHIRYRRIGTVTDDIRLAGMPYPGNGSGSASIATSLENNRMDIVKIG